MLAQPPQGVTIMKIDSKTKLERREFLRVMGGGVGIGAAMAVAATTIVGEAVAAESMEEAKKARYQPDSADVKNFYRVNRF